MSKIKTRFELTSASGYETKGVVSIIQQEPVKKSHLSVEELLKTRYKVIAAYPHSIFDVGEILQIGNYDGHLLYKWVDGIGVECEEYEVFFKDYPHLFQKLEWWQERSESEMPEYVKDKNGVYKIKNFAVKNECKVFEIYDFDAMKRGSGWSIFLLDKLRNFAPSTEQEFINFKGKEK